MKNLHVLNLLIYSAFAVIKTNYSSRTLKLLWVIMLVVVASVLCFLLVKYSVDWAGVSKMDLNKMKDEELSKITDEINLVFNMHRNYNF